MNLGLARVTRAKIDGARRFVILSVSEMSESSNTPARSAYVVGPVYDWVFFLGPPVLALLAGWLISGTDFADEVWSYGDEVVYETTWSAFLIGVVIHAHLVIVFFRSHGNGEVLRSYPFRFLVVPAALYVGMLWSDWVLISCSVLATFWDVYHSGAQTFGFARIYDGKAGNDPHEGRTLDVILNQFLYAGPIVAGAVMMDHFEDFNEYEPLEAKFFTSIPAFMEGNQAYFAWSIIISGTLFLAYYVYANWRMHQSGREVSWQKIYILVSTGLVSIYTWGFNSFGEAFFIMNLFHAVQYFGIVWAMENKNMSRMFRADRLGQLAKPITALVFVGLAIAYGVWVELINTEIRTLWAITMVVSLMHFWYDGFIWSVRKKQA